MTDEEVNRSGSMGSHATLPDRNPQKLSRRRHGIVQGLVRWHQGQKQEVRNMLVRPRVEEAFGFASAQVLDFADLYAGKLAAALSRQHPRDLFDIGPLLDDERADVTLWRTFLVYLTCSPKPAWEILAPRESADFEATFDAHFKGMTAEPVSAAQFLDNRARLLARVAD
jgi:hypothetical protein